ncbi:MAG: putative Ig domain-containing protein, partial [Chthoniobacterales bacterium]|nr:putative Ig domain-containing protein [Chthoniobacterales bacterium]
FNSYRGPEQSDAGGPIFDFHRVALHEFGHALGLSHPDERGQSAVALMNSEISDLDGLTADDIAGARSLYGFRVTSSLVTINLNAGQAFTYQIAADNTPTAFSASGLPPGVDLNPVTGLISGTPTAGGTFVATIRATSSRGTATATFTIIVRGPQIVSGLITAPVSIGSSFTYRISADNAPTNFGATGLPDGLSLDATTGIISGIPTLSGTHFVVIRASGQSGDAVATLQIRVLAASSVEAALARFPMYLDSLVADPVRSRVYASSSNSVVVINTKTLLILKTIPVGSTVWDMNVSPDGAVLWLGMKGPNIGRIDLETLTVLPSLTTSGYVDNVLEGLDRRLYVTYVNGDIGQVDAATGIVQANIRPDERPYPVKCTIELSPDRNTLYVGTLLDTAVLAKYDISTATTTLLQRIPVESTSLSGLTLSHDGRLLCFTASRTTPIRRTNDLGLEGMLDLGTAHGPMIFSRDDSLAFQSTRPQSNTEQNKVVVYDLTTSYQIIRTIPFTQTLGFSRLAVDSTGTYLFAYATSGSTFFSSPPALEVFPVRPPAPVLPKPKSLLNVSTRVRAQPGDDALIGGFILVGEEPKTVAVRAIGPSLPLPGRLSDPTLELRDAGGALVAGNNNWNARRSEVLRTSLAPSDEHEAVIVATLQPGTYTAKVGGVNQTSGIALIEIYDLSSDSPARLANISTRGKVETGDNVMIGGFIIGSGAPTKVIVRAIGPSLTERGVPGALADTALALHDGNGTKFAENDDWQSDQPQEIVDSTVPPTNARESAIVRTLAPGNYTAILRGKSDTSGIALVEVYNLEPR